MNKRFLHIFLIIAAGLLAYSNTFHVPFQFDDDPNIAENPLIKNFAYFIHPSEAEGLRSYHEFTSRFIGFLTFALNYHIHGLDVTGYHVVNLAIHIINGLLVYRLVLLTFQTPYFSRLAEAGAFPAKKGGTAVLTALFSALFFISHPVQTQAVTYIIQRLASLATMFYLLSLILYAAWRLAPKEPSGKKQRPVKAAVLYLAALVAAVLAMKTKEIAFTLPLMIMLYEFLFFEGTGKERVLSLLPILLTLLIIPLTWAAADMGYAIMPSRVSWSDYLFTQFRVIVTYLRLILLPVNQNLDYDYPISHSFLEPAVLLSFLLLLSLLGLALSLLRRSRLIPSVSRVTAFGILWFFIALSAESGVIPIADVIFEHRVYLPSVGLFIAGASLLYRSSFETPRLFLVSAIVLVWLVAAFNRNEIWQTKYSLWSDTAQKSPKNARVHNNLANCHALEGRYWEAILEYTRANEADPGYLEVYVNLMGLGAALERDGHRREASYAYTLVCRKAPELLRNQKAAACERAYNLR